MPATRTILVVDDEPRLREVIASALEDLGYRTLLAESGEAAIGVIEADDVDLVLTDLRMPVMDGRELLHQVRNRWPACLSW
jgi:two-component system response regulator AtoC